jgi:hypothetical protein
MANDDHLALSAAQKAKLIRNQKYRDNGHQHISGSGRKDRYAGDHVEAIQTALDRRGTQPRGGGCKPASPEHAARYAFTYKKNFKLGITRYSKQGHHLLPEEAFTEKLLGRKERYLVAQVDYDINNGENILFLPVSAADTEFHLLPYHSGSHRQYTAQVVTDMRKVKNDLKREIDKDPDHEKWKPPQDILTTLKNLQDDYWGYLTADFTQSLAVNAFRKPTSPAARPGAPRGLGKR